MALDREAVYAALFARLQSKIGANVTTYSRRALDLDHVPASMQPTLLQLATTETPDYPGRGSEPARWTLGAMVIIYARAQPDATTPETTLHDLARRVELALDASAGEGVPTEVSTTLGNLIIWARISGSIEVHQGADADQGAIMIPIEMSSTA